MLFSYKIMVGIILALSLIITFPGFAYAYLDPGTGSYILQILIAAFFGALFALKRYWHRVKLLLSNLFMRHKSGNNNE
jgi:hypothetical protein